MSGAEPLLIGALAPELLGAAGATAATAGTAAAAGVGAGALGAAGAGASAGALGAGAGLLGGAELGAAGAGMAGGLGSGMAGIPLAAEAAAPTMGAGGLMSFTTPSVFPMGSGMAGLSSMPTAAEAVPAWQSALGMAQNYGAQAGKAASTYSTINSALGGGQHPMPQGPSRPVFQGPAPQIAPQQQAPQENQFARMLMEKRMRGGMMG